MSQAKAVVNIGNSQYFVEAGQEILVDQLSQETGEYVINDVLLAISGDNVVVGQPTIKGAKVVAKILGREQGEKIRVEKYKAKSRYHKVRGARAQLTKLQISQVDIREK